MIGIVMAGGKGTRMELEQEKLLLKYKKPVILHVIDALDESKCFSKVMAITSPNSPKTKALLAKSNIEIVDSSGTGFVTDLNQVLNSISDPVFVTSGDLPFLDGKIIKNIVSLYNTENIWTSIIVTKEFLDSLNLTSEFMVTFNDQKCFFTGISLINTKKINNLTQIKETFQILDDKRVAFNLNTKQDYELLNAS
ncbi:MAG: NTP transferase domain-containing protein [Nitrosopumilaceae archaeon]